MNAASPLVERLERLFERWRRAARLMSEARTLPLAVVCGGAAAGALFADRLVRSMWRHAIFTGPDQWRTAALALIALWTLIGAVTAVALLGPPADEAPAGVGEAEDGPWVARGATADSLEPSTGGARLDGVI